MRHGDGRGTFAVVTVAPGHTTYCGFADRCVVHDVTWDAVTLTENECRDERLTDAELRRLGGVLESLGSGPPTPCPYGLCAEGGMLSWYCNDGNRSDGDGCDSDCNEEPSAGAE